MHGYAPSFARGPSHSPLACHARAGAYQAVLESGAVELSPALAPANCPRQRNEAASRNVTGTAAQGDEKELWQ